MIFIKSGKEKTVENKSRKIKKRIFRCTVLAMAILMACGGCLSITASAASKPVDLGTSGATKAYAPYTHFEQTGWFPWQGINYSIKTWANPNYAIMYVGGNSSTEPIFKKSNNYTINLSQGSSISLGVKDSFSLSTGIDFTSYGVPISVGGSVETTYSKTVTASSSTGVTIKDTAPEGYYSFNLCLNTNKVKASKYDGSKYISSIFFHVPAKKTPFRAVVYSSDNTLKKSRIY